MCIHVAAYYFFCIVWFEIKFQIDLNLYSKLVWKISLEKEKENSLPSHSQPAGLVSPFSSLQALGPPAPLFFSLWPSPVQAVAPARPLLSRLSR